MARFGRVLTAMVTPFRSDGSLDIEGAGRLARWLVANGNEGLVVAGTTGESPTLTHAEQAELVAAVVAAVDVPVVAGAGSNDTRAAIDLTERCTAAGAQGILHVAGYYNRPSQDGLDAHFRHCAAATDLPVIIYDIPGRTGRKVATETLVRLAHEVDNIVALKDAAGHPDETARLLDLAPEGFEVYSGDDSLTLPLMAIGAVGTIGVATHWIGKEVAAMFDAFESGMPERAAAINRHLLDSYDFESSDEAPNPVPTKCMLRVMGLPAGPCRLPMGPEPTGLEARAIEILEALKPQEPPPPDAATAVTAPETDLYERDTSSTVPSAAGLPDREVREYVPAAGLPDREVREYVPAAGLPDREVREPASLADDPSVHEIPESAPQSLPQAPAADPWMPAPLRDRLIDRGSGIYDSMDDTQGSESAPASPQEPGPFGSRI